MSVRDIGVMSAVLFGFVLLVTAHVLIVAGLFGRLPRWRAPVAFVVAPLAPYWALREHMRVRGILWLAAAVIYVVALILAR